MDPAKAIFRFHNGCRWTANPSAGEESEHTFWWFLDPVSSATNNCAGNLILSLCVRLICGHSWEFNYLHPVTIHFRAAFNFPKMFSMLSMTEKCHMTSHVGSGLTINFCWRRSKAVNKRVTCSPVVIIHGNDGANLAWMLNKINPSSTY